MKKKDIALIIVVASISAIVASVVTNAVLGPKKRNEKVEIVEPIVSTFPEADKKYFNENSIDPTQLIRIGENTNPAPFNAQ